MIANTGEMHYPKTGMILRFWSKNASLPWGSGDLKIFLHISALPSMNDMDKNMDKKPWIRNGLSFPAIPAVHFRVMVFRPALLPVLPLWVLYLYESRYLLCHG